MISRQDFELIAKVLKDTRPFSDTTKCPSCKSDLTENIEQGNLAPTGDHCPSCDEYLGNDGKWIYTSSGWDTMSHNNPGLVVIETWKSVVLEFQGQLLQYSSTFDPEKFFRACGWEVAA